MKYLVFILHGYTCKVELYDSIVSVITAELPNSVVKVPALPMSTFSTADPNKIVQHIIKEIDDVWTKEKEPETRIILIGHSTGALLARKTYLIACGENSDAPFENTYKRRSALPWAENIDRIILFAGMNRGWTINDHLYNWRALSIRLGLVLGKIMWFFGATPLPFKTRRGAPFVTQLRIQWISMVHHASDLVAQEKRKKVGNTTVIQMLGTKDDLISPEDSVDMVTGANFIYLEVPQSGHLDVLDLTEKIRGKNRKAVFKKALLGTTGSLKNIMVTPTDQGIQDMDPTVTDVIFVIHGIRDTGYWTQKLARRVHTMVANSQQKFKTETATYGYFPMLPFILYYERRKKVAWLMERYIENLAFYPNAEFSFMGHSNGTYLLAKALETYPACRFKHVVFGGSVVRSNYDWEGIINEGRISKFINIVATKDWVVSVFPKSFQLLRLQDIGGGGFDGFQTINSKINLKFIDGSHGAITDEKYWDELAHFLVHGEIVKN